LARFSGLDYNKQNHSSPGKARPKLEIPVENLLAHQVWVSGLN